MHIQRIQDVEEAFSLATGIRQRIVAIEESSRRLLNTLVLHEVFLREQKAQRFQRIQQLYKVLAKEHIQDFFEEINKPLDEFSHRWVQFLNKSLYSSPCHWIYSLAELSSTDSAPSETGAQATRRVTTIISQNNNIENRDTKGEPASILALRRRTFTNGYIAAQMKLHSAEGQKVTLSCGGFVFKFQNEKDYGFITLCSGRMDNKTSISPSGTLVFGRVHNAQLRIFSRVPYKQDVFEWFLVGLEFSSSHIRVCVNGATVYYVELINPWTDGGSIGLHSTLSRVSFRNVVTGPPGSESHGGRFVLKALEKLPTQEIKLRQWTPEEYINFLKDTDEKVSSAAVDSLIAKSSNETSKNGALCFNYERSTLNINDWDFPQQAVWSIIQDASQGAQRWLLDKSTSRLNMDYTIILKNFSCKTASVVFEVYCYPESQAGIVVNNKDTLNRWMYTIDANTGVARLIRIRKGIPEVLGFVSIPNLNDSELHKLELTQTSSQTTMLITGFLDEKRILTYTTSLEDFFNEVHGAQGDSQWMSGRLGLVVGKGTIEVVSYRVHNTQPFDRAD